MDIESTVHVNDTLSLLEYVKPFKSWFILLIATFLVAHYYNHIFPKFIKILPKSKTPIEILEIIMISVLSFILVHHKIENGLNHILEDKAFVLYFKYFIYSTIISAIILACYHLLSKLIDTLRFNKE